MKNEMQKRKVKFWPRSTFQRTQFIKTGLSSEHWRQQSYRLAEKKTPFALTIFPNYEDFFFLFQEVNASVPHGQVNQAVDKGITRSTPCQGQPHLQT